VLEGGLVPVHLGPDPVLVPAQLGRDEAGDVLGRGGGGVPAEQPGPGPAREHVVEGGGHLLAHGVDGLGPPVGQPGDEGLVEGRVVVERTDSRGRKYSYDRPRLGLVSHALTAIGAFLTGMVSVGIGEVTISQLTRRRVPIAVAAATSVLVVILTIVFASMTLFAELVEAGGWTAIPWNLLIYDIPGVLIGGQLGPRLQGLVPQHRMRQAIGGLFLFLAVAMMFVAFRRAGMY